MWKIVDIRGNYRGFCRTKWIYDLFDKMILRKLETERFAVDSVKFLESNKN